MQSAKYIDKIATKTESFTSQYENIKISLCYKGSQKNYNFTKIS
jgi:hypothetical protein